MPAAAPRAVPRRQTRPPRKAGAICATAANDKRPIDGQRRVAGEARIEEAERQDAEDRERGAR